MAKRKYIYVKPLKKWARPVRVPAQYIEILVMLRHGYSKAQAALELGIRRNYIENITFQMNRQLGCSNTPHLLCTLMQQGIIK